MQGINAKNQPAGRKKAGRQAVKGQQSGRRQTGRGRAAKAANSKAAIGERAKKIFKKKVTVSLVVLITAITMFSLVSVTGAFAQAPEEEAAARHISEEQGKVIQFGLIAAAVAFGFGAIGAGIAIANVGSAAMGAIAEKPEIAAQALIFIALAEGLVVFGFITALMILGKV